MTLKVTPCGTESGAEPILDWHDDVVVKVLWATGPADAGKRKFGTSCKGCTAALSTHCAHRRRAGANMAWLRVMSLAGIF
jgi:hypothetical protein